MKVVVCGINSVEQVAFYGDRLSGKIIHGIDIARHCVWENHSSGKETPDKVTGCLEKLLWTNDWKTK